LKQKWGDDWQKYAKASILYVYDQLVKKRQQSPPATEEPEGDHESPPGTEIA